MILACLISFTSACQCHCLFFILVPGSPWVYSIFQGEKSSVNIQWFSITLFKVHRILQKFIKCTFLQIKVGSWGHSLLITPPLPVSFFSVLFLPSLRHTLSFLCLVPNAAFLMLPMPAMSLFPWMPPPLQLCFHTTLCVALSTCCVPILALLLFSFYPVPLSFSFCLCLLLPHSSVSQGLLS